MGRAFYTPLPIAQKFLLVALCDHANDEGGGVFVGQRRLAVKVGTTDRTVRTNLAVLRDEGYIERVQRGSGEGRRGVPDHYRIVVERLPTDAEIDALLAEGTPEDSSADHSGTPETHDKNTGSLEPDHRKQLLPPNQKQPPVTQPKELSRVLSFDEFWKVYPRHEGRAVAFKAFEKALRKTDVETIFAGAARYRDDPNREAAYTLHGSTWLNQERWDDPPLPVRSKPRRVGQSEELLRRAMEG